MAQNAKEIINTRKRETREKLKNGQSVEWGLSCTNCGWTFGADYRETGKWDQETQNFKHSRRVDLNSISYKLFVIE